VDSLDLQHDAPQIKLNDRNLSHKDLGMVRFDEDEDSKEPVPTQETFSQVAVKGVSNPDLFHFGSKNRSNSLGIQYVETDDLSSEEEDTHFAAQLKGGMDRNVPGPQTTRQVAASKNSSLATRKSSHNISQHAIDALLGVSSASQERPGLLQNMQIANPHSFRRSPAEEKFDGPAIFAISSDRESEFDAPFDQARNLPRPPMIDTTASAPARNDVLATRRIASSGAASPAIVSPASNSFAGEQRQQPVITSPPSVMHYSIRQTVPFDGSAPLVSPIPTEDSVSSPPEVSSTDTNIISQAVVQTPPPVQGRNASSQRLPYHGAQDAPQALASPVQETTNESEQIGRHSLVQRRKQDSQDINTARRRSMSATEPNRMSPMTMNNNLGMPRQPNNVSNNWALQQAILHQQQMQQLQQLQQQQQQLHMMASMGMTTVPMVTNTGMIYQQPIMAVKQSNVLAINSLTQSISATAASLALITAPPAAAPMSSSMSMLPSNSLVSSSGLISSMMHLAMPNDMTVLNNTATPAVIPMSFEEQLLTRQREVERQVERENDAQLCMAIEQSLHLHQPQYRPQPATLPATSSMSRSTSQHQVLEHHIVHSGLSSLTPSPAIRALNPTSLQASALRDQADDAALQMALMMSLEEQLHEQQSVLNQVHVQSFGHSGSRSPATRVQQQALLSRQSLTPTSHNPSPGAHTVHRSEENQNTGNHYLAQYESRPPSCERVVNFLRRSRDEILHDRKSCSTSPAVCRPSPVGSGLTSQASSNNNSFRGQSGQVDGYHTGHYVPPPSYHDASNHHSAPCTSSSLYESFPPEYTAPPPAYREAIHHDSYLGVKTKTLVRRSFSVDPGQVPA
jgi:hypothetical protein